MSAKCFLQLRAAEPVQKEYASPEGPCTQLLGTWVWGNSNYSTGFGQVYNYWVLGPLGFHTKKNSTESVQHMDVPKHVSIWEVVKITVPFRVPYTS